MATKPGTNNLLAWWELDEASGNRADSHGSYTLTDNNTVGTAQGGADFDNANSETLTNTSANLSWGDEAVTITGWIWLDDVASAHGFAGRHEATGNHRQFRIYNNGSGKWVVGVSSNGTNQTYEENTTKANATGEWIFIAFYHDPTANTIGLRINASLQSMSYSSGLSDDQTDDFTLGGYGGGTYLDGKLKVVNVWNAVLSSDELDWLYNSGTARSYSDVSAATFVPRTIIL